MERKYILWMVCSFTRFIKGVVLQNKEAKTILKAVIQHWNCNYGMPSVGYWCDNGTEFKNAEMSEYCDKSGLTIRFGPAYSPWANGINERNHASADKIIMKIMEDDKKNKVKRSSGFRKLEPQHEREQIGFFSNAVSNRKVGYLSKLGDRKFGYRLSI